MNAATLLAQAPQTLAARAAPTVTTRCITTLAALERELADGLRQSWKQVVDDDPLASCFQSSGWCLPWYRAYRDEYEPYVILVSTPERLAGIVPLAVRRDDGQIMFASGAMADYRDIVALPAYRRQVAAELIRVYLDGHFPNPLEVGWLDPASDTRRLVEDICREQRVPLRVRSQPCYRWFPPPPQKPSAQKFLNWYKRQGAVSFDVITSEADWTTFREEYYHQHSLRQIQTGRDRAFDDPRRTAFYEQLFHSPEVETHVTAFNVDGRILAGHFGYVWRGVLLLGPPAIRLEDEQRSPAVILLAWIIQNAEKLGLRGFDLTIGDSDFKKRLANVCVELTTVEVYGRRDRYYARAARMRAVQAAKTIVAATAGADAWNRFVKPSGAWLAYKKARIAEAGVAAAARMAVRGLWTAIHERREGLIYSMVPSQLRGVEPRLAAGSTFAVHDNCVEDLLLWTGSAASTASAITSCARSYSRARSTGRTLHTVVVDGRLAGWGYSYYPSEPAKLSETPGAVLEFDPGSVSLYDFHVIPEFRGRRLYQALLTAILLARFGDGAPRAYITVLQSNTASRLAIERVGFQLTATNSYRRLLKWSSLTTGRVGSGADLDYATYLQDEWLLFAGDAQRQQNSVQAASGIEIRRVLDVGCGGGQDMIPFSAGGAMCVGIDSSHASGIFGRRLFARHYPQVPVHFATSTAERLPFTDGAFDVAVCRVAIPYTDNRAALTEIARVLRPGGILLLKTHHLRYYTRKFIDGIKRKSPLFATHALRVLLSGTIFHLTGRQPSGGILLRETFLTEGRLKKELARVGLSIAGELSDSNPLTRSYRVVKPAA
ncbi:MAG TPA: GNAT family N-acetyltransferase [Vicinamibacterales bacterium]|nr:GNAT family N-acetyltransferase [Vicinamibacterales bacterium]